ncbi:Permeases of the major facilitator superfamily [Xanthomonas citri subsp. citri Aw12879]|nr:Permeases of the major facilitator superfamily [Xanthomonas citri subsp. citri Aw12879]
MAVPASQGLPSGLSIGSIALLILGVQPILLGTLVEQKLITLSGVGIVAMGEIVALGLGVALGDALLPHRWQRQVAVLAALLAALLDLATTQAVGDTAFVLVRAAAGLAEGLLLWVATLTIVRAAKPDRVTAVFMLTQAVAQIALANLLAWWVLPSTGWKGGFVALCAVTLCAALLTPLLPARLSAVSATAPASRVRWSPTTLLPLLIAFVQMAAIGALWAYLEPLGCAPAWMPGGAGAHLAGADAADRRRAGGDLVGAPARSRAHPGGRQPGAGGGGGHHGACGAGRHCRVHGCLRGLRPGLDVPDALPRGSGVRCRRAWPGGGAGAGGAVAGIGSRPLARFAAAAAR